MSYSITDINDNTIRPSMYGVTSYPIGNANKIVNIYNDDESYTRISSSGIIVPIYFENGNSVACTLNVFLESWTLKVIGTTTGSTDYVTDPVYLAPGWYDVHFNPNNHIASVILGGIIDEIGSTLAEHASSTAVTITNPRSKYLISGMNLQPSGTYDSVSAWASASGDATWTITTPSMSGSTTSSTGIVTQYSGIAISWRVSTSRYFAPCDWYLGIPSNSSSSAALYYNFVNYNSSARAPSAFACGLLWEALYV